jgi:hypothetical protein
MGAGSLDKLTLRVDFRAECWIHGISDCVGSHLRRFVNRGMGGETMDMLLLLRLRWMHGRNNEQIIFPVVRGKG